MQKKPNVYGCLVASCRPAWRESNWELCALEDGPKVVVALEKEKKAFQKRGRTVLTDAELLRSLTSDNRDDSRSERYQYSYCRSAVEQ